MTELKPKRKYVRKPVQEPKPERLKVTRDIVHRVRVGNSMQENIFQPAPEIHPWKPADEKLALDSQFDTSATWALNAYSGLIDQGQAFLGYPLLSEMATRPEYRRAAETIARHMTRKWIKFEAQGEEDKADKIKAIEDELTKLHVKKHFQKCAELDGYFGRAHLFLDFGDWDNPDELKMPVGDGSGALSKSKCSTTRPLRRLKVVEPVWAYPLAYNANDPLHPDWYRPNVWSVMGKSMDRTRLLTFIGREVPDMLKPSYSFGGLSLSQMGKPAVDNWLQTRKSVNDIVSAFSVMVLKLNLQEVLQGAGEELFQRIELFNAQRDNRGLLTIGKEEEFDNVAAPLGTLDALQSQAQEHMASIWGIPIEILNGIQPMGLNASSEGQIRVFYDWIHSCQEHLFRDHLQTVINFIQLSLFNELDETITFQFNDLEALSDEESAAMELVKAQTHDIYANMGVVSAEEVRHAIANDPNSPYDGLDPDEMPNVAGEGEGWESLPSAFGIGTDSFNEQDHPRADNGKFGSGIGKTKLSSREKAEVDRYSGDTFLELNGKLRNGDASDSAVKHLDSAIEKSDLPNGTKVYRGMSRESARNLFKDGEVKIGAEFSDKAYSSTSTSKGIASMSAIGGVMLEIESGPGAKGLDMKGMSRNEHENEVLLPRGAKMKVTGIRAPKSPGDPVRIIASYSDEGQAHDEYGL